MCPPEAQPSSEASCAAVPRPEKWATHAWVVHFSGQIVKPLGEGVAEGKSAAFGVIFGVEASVSPSLAEGADFCTPSGVSLNAP